MIGPLQPGTPIIPFKHVRRRTLDPSPHVELQPSQLFQFDQEGQVLKKVKVIDFFNKRLLHYSGFYFEKFPNSKKSEVIF